MTKKNIKYLAISILILMLYLLYMASGQIIRDQAIEAPGAIQISCVPAPLFRDRPRVFSEPALENSVDTYTNNPTLIVKYLDFLDSNRSVGGIILMGNGREMRIFPNNINGLWFVDLAEWQCILRQNREQN